MWDLAYSRGPSIDGPAGRARSGEASAAVGEALEEVWMKSKRKLEQWRQMMTQFHRESQEGLGGFGIAVVRTDDVPSISKSKDGDAVPLRMR